MNSIFEEKDFEKKLRNAFKNLTKIALKEIQYNNKLGTRSLKKTLIKILKEDNLKGLTVKVKNKDTFFYERKYVIGFYINKKEIGGVKVNIKSIREERVMLNPKAEEDAAGVYLLTTLFTEAFGMALITSILYNYDPSPLGLAGALIMAFIITTPLAVYLAEVVYNKIVDLVNYLSVEYDLDTYLKYANIRKILGDPKSRKILKRLVNLYGWRSRPRY